METDAKQIDEFRQRKGPTGQGVQRSIRRLGLAPSRKLPQYPGYVHGTRGMRFFDGVWVNPDPLDSHSYRPEIIRRAVDHGTGCTIAASSPWTRLAISATHLASGV